MNTRLILVLAFLFTLSGPTWAVDREGWRCYYKGNACQYNGFVFADISKAKGSGEYFCNLFCRGNAPRCSLVTCKEDKSTPAEMGDPGGGGDNSDHNSGGRCDSSVFCPSGWACEGGICVDVRGNGSTGNECSSDAQCPASCVNGYCVGG